MKHTCELNVVLLCIGVAQLLKLLQSPNSGEEQINMCEGKKAGRLLRFFPFRVISPVVNSSAEKYCMHIEFWALQIKSLRIVGK